MNNLSINKREQAYKGLTCDTKIYKRKKMKKTKEIEKLKCTIVSSGEVITPEEAKIRLAKYICMLIEWDLNPPATIKGV